MSTDLLFVEQYGTKFVQYSRKEPLKIERHEPQSSISSSICGTIINFFREVLLPHGYPDTVSVDYLEYQVWDTLQAFCSTITGTFTTRAILKGVGVGNPEASALSATVTWILKDGSGMIGRIIFAWWKGSELDCHSKKWRLFADILNDFAMAIELGVPYFTSRSMEILCVTSMMKSIVGIAGGATRASITHHQAIRRNMAEISAKDGTQETLVNLIASLSSLYLLSVITEPTFELPFIFLIMMLHIFFNFKAVTSLIFNVLNESRMVLVVNSYCKINTVPRPIPVNHNESVLLGRGMKISDVCGFKIKLGCSLSRVVKLYNYSEMERLINLYANQPYVIVSDVEKQSIYIALERGCEGHNIITSYFHGVMLALATSIYNNLPLEVEAKRQRNYTNPMARLHSLMHMIQRESGYPSNMTIDELKSFNKFMEPEINMFLTSLQINGWETSVHSLCLDEWRIDWKSYLEKNK